MILGRNEVLYATAKHLAENTDHRPVGIVTTKASPEYLKDQEDFRALAAELGIPFVLASLIDDDVMKFARTSGAEIVVSTNWVSILAAEFISLFTHGVLNAHYGDLPRFRGNAVTNWALLLDEPEIAFTIYCMLSEELDSGDILAQDRMEIGTGTTIAEINARAEIVVPGMFADVLDGLERGDIHAIPQRQTGLAEFRCYPRLPRDGKIDWALPASKIDALVRSMTDPYSGAYTFMRTAEGDLEKLFIWKSHVILERTDDIGVFGHVIRNDKENGDSWIYTGDGILAIQSCSYGTDGVPFQPGKVWKSIRKRLGMDIDEEIYRLVRGGH